MKKKNESADFFSRLWNFFASIRLTVVLLLSLAVTSMVGTFIPQNQSPAAYFHEYGEFFYKILSVLNIFDMYHSWWFQLLLLMLTINVIICSLNRFSTTWKIVFVKIPPFSVAKFRSLSTKEEFTSERPIKELKKKCEDIASKKFSYCRVEQTDKGFFIFAEKGRWTRLGVYAVHFSIILLLIGALTGSIFGFEGFVNIPEGETVNSIELRKTGQIHNLDFGIRCDDFSVSFYETGAPKEFRSTLSIIEDGKSVLKEDIIVNDPLRYKGINLFQSSYGMLPPEKITLNIVSRETGMAYKKTAKIGQPIEIPEGMGTLVIKDYRDSFNYKSLSLGETFIGILNKKDGNSINIILPLHFDSFDKMRKGDFIFSVTEYDNRYYTGLQVTSDPGVLVVYSGFIVMIIGCFGTFFMSHQRLCIEIAKSGNNYKVIVAGTANKNKLGMQARVKRLSQNLARL
ncbi:MAG: cytochrome c biogenesis protein ResB [Proteobacteria bacterium]|nr:cytochrome c biogenesis protein ResB [Pseudomonadota bacterium]MBU4389558.1 cytochrome c biogenesis protein ResB [Pseudomonadota bacterium]MBU4419780.1 cytochrome c biogenesis protein ResB [Pseudomonadota bacterium]MBU4504724.1 cytochrome c biogenesis protein ResB [Pseudomonadota bacterium]MCG2831111.1 cytochrome c biogenesis protein ResB [Desulfobacteraceae bacterium]